MARSSPSCRASGPYYNPHPEERRRRVSKDGATSDFRRCRPSRRRFAIPQNPTRNCFVGAKAIGSVIARREATKQSLHQNWIKSRWMDCFAFRRSRQRQGKSATADFPAPTSAGLAMTACVRTRVLRKRNGPRRVMRRGALCFAMLRKRLDCASQITRRPSRSRCDAIPSCRCHIVQMAGADIAPPTFCRRLPFCKESRILVRWSHLLLFAVEREPFAPTRLRGQALSKARRYRRLPRHSHSQERRLHYNHAPPDVDFCQDEREGARMNDSRCCEGVTASLTVRA